MAGKNNNRYSLLFCGFMLLGAAAPLAAETAAGVGRREARQATFEARHELKVTLPEEAKRVRVWLTIPQDVPEQKATDFKVESPFPFRIERDATEGNKFLYIEAVDPKVKDFTVVNTFRLTRREVLNELDPKRTRPLSDAERKELARFLEPNRHVIIDERIRRLAAEIVGRERNPVRAARKIYDWIIDYADYWVKDPSGKKASPVGSTEYCLTTRTGNCTDFHSLWASIARAAGIPTRIIYGSFFKKELDGKDIDQSYHCWIEFYAPAIGWVPHDAALADLFADEIALTPENSVLVQRTTGSGYFGKDPRAVDYYFGNLDERRVTWSVGRDLTLSPKQEGEPVNAMAKAYVEIDGKMASEGTNWTRKLTYKEVKGAFARAASR